MQNYNYLFNYGPRGFAPGPLAAGQVSVNQSQYLDIATAAIREVWARYPGSIYEVRRTRHAYFPHTLTSVCDLSARFLASLDLV